MSKDEHVSPKCTTKRRQLIGPLYPPRGVGLGQHILWYPSKREILSGGKTVPKPEKLGKEIRDEFLTDGYFRTLRSNGVSVPETGI